MIQPEVSLVVPAYNEAHRIGDSLTRMIEHFQAKKMPYEILVVDDHSHDATPEIVKEKASFAPSIRYLRQASHLGKGAAVRRGMLEAQGRWVFMSDADLAVPLKYFDAALPVLMHEYEMVYGIRTIQTDVTWGRRVAGLVFMLLAHLIVFDFPVIDSQCPFKGFRNEIAKRIFSKSFVNGGTIDIEVMYLCHKLGINKSAMFVEWRNVPGSTINITKCLIQDPFDMMRIRLRRYSL